MTWQQNAKSIADREPELVVLRNRAKQMAAERKETPTTVHLLAALCAAPGPARELLAQRRLDEAHVLSAARSFEETVDQPIDGAISAARKLAQRVSLPAVGRMQPVTPGAIHLLLAMLSNQKYAAHRALDQCGVDIGRLKTAVTRASQGVFTPMRSGEHRTGQEDASRAREPSSRPPSIARSQRRQRAVEVPWIPAPEHAAPAALSSQGVSGSLELSELEAADSGCEPQPIADDADLGGSGNGTSARASRSLAPRAGTPTAPSDELDAAACPLLARIGRNLTAQARRGELEAVVGREREIERVLDILAKRHANNPLLVGLPGVGKTTVARGVAARLAARQRSDDIIVEIPVTELLAGTGSRGSLAERIADLRAELARVATPVVLFIDEIHELFGASADEALAELKAALAAGQLPMIGATSPEQYRKVIESDPALARRFSLVEIEPPSEEEAIQMLTTVCARLAEHHGIRYQREAVAQSVAWSVRYMPGRALPDKALAILDLAGARLRRRDQERAAHKRRGGQLEVDTRAVAEVVAETALVPIDRLTESDAERMLRLEQLMADRVVGHAEPCSRIAAVLRRNAAGLRGRRPLGTFLLLGPTGVGKTEAAKAIAEILFHSPDAMTRLDMSEYAEPHAVARLVGAPPGYVGHEAGGLLTEAVRKRPYQVILLDEIEKAHRDVLESFLQVFDEGRLTDGRGRTADFTNAVIVMTSNLGAAEMRAAQSERRVGFTASARALDADSLGEVALRSAREALPPELYNRIDEVLFFAPLAKAEVGAIARRLLARLADSLARRGVTMEVDDAVIDALLERGGYDPELGARPMRRAVVRLIEAPLADMILAGELAAGSIALVGVDDGGELIIDALPPRDRVANAR